MKRHMMLLSVVLALLTVFWGAVPAAARATVTEFTALEATCSVIPGTEWVSGNVLHIRNEVDTTRVASTAPLTNGTNTVVVNVDLNLKNGSGDIHGTFSLQPDGVNGAWVGDFSGHVTDSVFFGHAVGQGTGELAGMKDMVSLQGTEVPANQPCPGPALGADIVTGRILNPHG